MRGAAMWFGDGAIELPAHRNLDSITLVLRAGGTTSPASFASPTQRKGSTQHELRLDNDEGSVDILKRAF